VGLVDKVKTVGMKIHVGDIVTMTITRVEAYALWGTHQGLTGFIHCSDLTDEPPIPLSKVPKVGDSVKARIHHLAPGTEVEYPFGKMVCDFAASLVLVKKTA
jgi:ribosomal protein S1